MIIKQIYFISVFLLLAIAIISCSDSISNNDLEPCPPTDLVFVSPYNSPVWHPDNKYIGFNYTPLDSITYPNSEHCMGIQHFNYDSSGFWLVNIDGTNKHRILQYRLQTPVWSPDGKWIAFVLGAQIYKMPFNGEVFDTMRVIRLTNSGNNYSPSWSPDGNWITYDSDEDSPNGMRFIWKMESDGSNKQRIAYTPELGEVRSPNWSAHDKIIHYRYSTEYNSNELYMMDATGQNIERLTYNEFTERHPKCSTSDVVAYHSTNGLGDSPQLWILDLVTGNNKQLTMEGTDNWVFSWSPDGSSIAYVRYDYNDSSYDNGVIMLIEIQHRIKRQLTFNTHKI